MHTAEHILNQTMVRMFACERSFSNHLEKKKSKCDYRFDRPLSENEETELALRVNEQILKNLEVSELIVSRDEAATMFNLSNLPDASGETVRLVSVGDYDMCPCIGHHVANTSEIGTFVIGSTTFEEGVLRIRFKLKR